MHLSKKIVLLHPSIRSMEDLQKLADALYLDTTIAYDGSYTENFEFHLTLFVSNEKVIYPNFTYFLPSKIHMHGNFVDKLGPKATVLLMRDTNVLQFYHKHLSQEMKVTHSYDDLKPHISLSYTENKNVVLPQIISKSFWVDFDRYEIKDFTSDE